ncbi:tetraspanihypothetical protein [Limosa lapponica baueri]|uniref:Tetraspanin-7 n=1 Tax=Limosa lapponica baueri TaxID=1758121 RepID=A0A2I0TRY8_LIMLA|nr:tetraspanihypothetical protein [Limosa lapponica baueri]
MGPNSAEAFDAYGGNVTVNKDPLHKQLQGNPGVIVLNFKISQQCKDVHKKKLGKRTKEYRQDISSAPASQQWPGGASKKFWVNSAELALRTGPSCPTFGHAVGMSYRCRVLKQMCQHQITGVILLAVGVWGKLTLGTYISLIAENSTNAPYVLIGTGTTIIVFGLFGCFATCRGSPWMLKLYAMFLSLVFLAELVAGISGFVFRHEVAELGGSIRISRDVTDVQQ